MTKRITDIPELSFLWQWENLYLAGQPTVKSLEELQKRGVKKLLNLRGDGEEDFSLVQKFCSENGIEYVHIPVMGQEGLSAEACELISKEVSKSDGEAIVHCKTANRVGGWLITYLVNHRGMGFDDAVDIASESGLSNFGFVSQAETVVKLKS